jgi:spermidine synthase
MVHLLAPLLAISGAAALCGEVVWMRRLALATGSTGLALTLTLAGYMAGLGLGGAWAGRRTWRNAPRGYGALELTAAGWMVAFPWLLDVAAPLFHGNRITTALTAAAIVVPPGLLHGATLPAVSAALSDARDVSRLYAANTAGAVVGVLLGTFLLMPAAGLRGTELAAAALAGTVGLAAMSISRRPRTADEPSLPGRAPLGVLAAAALAGGAALGLEVVWSRLGALLLGSSVYAVAIVLAVFLAGIAAGAALGRRLGAGALGGSLVALGLLAIAGTLPWRALPHALGLAWSGLGEAGLLPAGAALLAVAMAGAPVASGATFSAALAGAGGGPTRAAGRVLAANTLGSVIGATLTGLLLVPMLGLRGATLLLGSAAVVGGVALLPWRKGAAALLGACLLALVSPAWDPALYAVGVGLRVGEFADLSPRAIEKFAHDGWVLRYAEDGRTASVAVGESTRTGNLWLSINGKVDASTGDDMPTQELSGQLPVAISLSRAPDHAPRVAVVGLASGVTAGAALEAGAGEVTIIELEPRVIEAAAFFSAANRDVLADPRATIVVDDARAWLGRPGAPYDIIVSEPSNPWITGVSNLFTQEYWELGRRRLAPGGVFVQWVQLYALPPDGLRSLVATFHDVFPQSWLFETIPGSDALLVAIHEPNAALPSPHLLPLLPTLGPRGVTRLAGRVRRNTDDRPWIEFEAPRWLHRRTGVDNGALIERAAAAEGIE